jgi:hypothetical protein
VLPAIVPSLLSFRLDIAFIFAVSSFFTMRITRPWFWTEGQKMCEWTWLLVQTPRSNSTEAQSSTGYRRLRYATTNDSHISLNSDIDNRGNDGVVFAGSDTLIFQHSKDLYAEF